jgi:hypothetical protein
VEAVPASVRHAATTVASVAAYSIPGLRPAGVSAPTTTTSATSVPFKEAAELSIPGTTTTLATSAPLVKAAELSTSKNKNKTAEGFVLSTTTTTSATSVTFTKSAELSIPATTTTTNSVPLLKAVELSTTKKATKAVEVPIHTTKTLAISVTFAKAAELSTELSTLSNTTKPADEIGVSTDSKVGKAKPKETFDVEDMSSCSSVTFAKSAEIPTDGNTTKAVNWPSQVKYYI